MSTIGYGDVSPKTQYERMYEIFGMILGASVYAYMVGAICSIVASMNAASAEFNQQMDRSVILLSKVASNILFGLNHDLVVSGEAMLGICINNSP